MIAEETNRFLQSVNSDERVSHDSYRARGILKEPMIHMGAKAWQAEKRGQQTRAGNENRRIRKENAGYEAEMARHAAAMEKVNQRTSDIQAEVKTGAAISGKPSIGRKKMSDDQGDDQRRGEQQRQAMDAQTKGSIDQIQLFTELRP
jgi:hypothetical protein